MCPVPNPDHKPYGLCVFHDIGTGPHNAFDNHYALKALTGPIISKGVFIQRCLGSHSIFNNMCRLC